MRKINGGYEIMMNYKKYTRQYFMPPVSCTKWVQKEYS